MSVPDEVRDRLRDLLWERADKLDWLALGSTAKTRHYANWTSDRQVGGVLSRYLDIHLVRLYIKDSLLKAYPQARLADARAPFRLLGVPETAGVTRVFIKPHGRQLSDGRVISWGPAAGWKAVLMAAHERSFGIRGACPFGVVLTQSASRFSDDASRAVVADAAAKLGIAKLVWSP
ncbi:MAG TPA: hypothetical protein DDY78_25870 [Planctomycetales bacterium]|jgi:hypothetical protein|nr:hypothetical protein [Planctomycetales bacterium]